MARITGPRHNLLDLAVEESPGSFTATFEFLPAVGTCFHPSLNRDDIIRAVLTAVDEANQKLGTSYAVRRIRVPVNDTPPEAVYGVLASAIIERAHANDADA